MRVVLFHVLIFLLVFFIFFDTKKLFPAELKKYRFFTAVLTFPQRAEFFRAVRAIMRDCPISQEIGQGVRLAKFV